MQQIMAPGDPPSPTGTPSGSSKVSAERRKALETLITLIYTANHQDAPSGHGMTLELTVWGYSLEDIPTRHIAECLRRALRNKRDPYMLKADAVMREWDLYREELVAQATAAPEYRAPRLPPAQQKHYSLEAWKAKHNLPADWRPEQPYPPESDLYGALVPAPRVDVPEPLRKRGEYWHERKSKPWQLYPNAARPERRVDRGGVEWLWWVDFCEGLTCPGFVLEHHGPDGKWQRALQCPDHAERFDAIGAAEAARATS